MGMNGEWMSMNGRRWMDETKQIDDDGCQIERGWTSDKTVTNVEWNDDGRRTKWSRMSNGMDLPLYKTEL